MDTAAGRAPCDAQHCEHSSCAAIKNNYDTTTNTFKTPPSIQRSDGSDALRQREPQIYTAPFQVSNQDKEKLQQGIPQPVQQPDADYQKPSGGDQGPWQPGQPYNPSGKSNIRIEIF